MKPLRNILLACITCFILAHAASAQTTDCPSGKVCIDQSTANKLFDVANQLVEAKDVIAKMLAERGASDAAIASALKTIDGYKELVAVKDLTYAEIEKASALKDKIIELQWKLIEKFEARLNKPKSGFSKILDALKVVGYILTGITLGRGFD